MNRETPTFPCAYCGRDTDATKLSNGPHFVFCTASCRRRFEKFYRNRYPDVATSQRDQLLAALRVVVLTGRTFGRLPSGAGFSDLNDIAAVPDFWGDTLQRKKCA
jgi:hypothetical protein